MIFNRITDYDAPLKSFNSLYSVMYYYLYNAKKAKEYFLSCRNSQFIFPINFLADRKLITYCKKMNNKRRNQTHKCCLFLRMIWLSFYSETFQQISKQVIFSKPYQKKIFLLKDNACHWVQSRRKFLYCKNFYEYFERLLFSIFYNTIF